MKEAIFNFIKEHVHCSLEELCSNVVGFNGDEEWYMNGNILLCSKCSNEAIKSIKMLIDEHRIFYIMDSPIDYLLEESRISGTEAKKCSKASVHSRCLPVTFSISGISKFSVIRSLPELT